jgi:hypothetical protein
MMDSEELTALLQRAHELFVRPYGDLGGDCLQRQSRQAAASEQTERAGTTPAEGAAKPTCSAREDWQNVRFRSFEL